MRIILICLVTFILPFVATAQEEMKIKFGNVTVEDLKKTTYSQFPNADAVILFEKATINFQGNNQGGLEYEMEVHRRIHFLNNKKLDQANIELLAYGKNLGDEEKVAGIKGVSYNLENNKIVESEMNDDAVFKNKKSEYYKRYAFTLPNVKEGTIIEYKYKIKSIYYYDLRPWAFENEIPTAWSELNANIPTMLTYVISSQGMYPFCVNKQEKTNIRFMANFQNSSTSASDWNSVSSEAISYKWAVKDIPAYQDEPYISSLNNYITKIQFQLSEIKIGGIVKRINNTWEKVNSEFLENENFNVVFEKNQKPIKQLLETIGIEDTMPALEKAKKIYTYISTEFTTSNDDYGVTMTKKMDKLIETKNGSYSDINLLMTACLQHINIASVPVIISLRSRGFINPIYPLTEKFNYVLSKAMIDDKEYILDPATDHLGFGKIHKESRNGYGRCIEKHGESINISPDSIREKSVSFVKMQINDGKLISNIQIKSNYDEALLYRSFKDSTRIFNEYKEKLPAFAVVENQKIDNLKKIEEPVTIFLDVSQPLDGDSLLYISPCELASTNKNPFKEKTRRLPIEFPYLFENNHTVNFKIPEGYIVDELPKSEAFSSDDAASLQFEFRCTEANGTISLRSKIKLNKTFFLAEEYETLSETYNLISKKHSEQIVLKRKL